MDRKHRLPVKSIPETLLKLGIVPADTPFNRRAQEYADHARTVAYYHRDREETADAPDPET